MRIETYVLMLTSGWFYGFKLLFGTEIMEIVIKFNIKYSNKFKNL